MAPMIAPSPVGQQHQHQVADKLSFEDTAVAFAAKSNWQLSKTYWIFASMNKQWLVKLGTFFIKLFFKLKLPIKYLIKPTVFDHFCGGETIEGCTPTISRLASSHVGTILDYSVEGEDDEKSFDATVREILRTIEKAHQMPNEVPFSVFKVTGIASADLLEKIQNNVLLNDQEKEAYVRVSERLDTLCRRAHELDVKIFVDAEESWIQDAIDMLTYEMMEKYNKERAIVYNTFQLYRKDMLENLVKATDRAAEKGYFLGAKLVRGAYMEKERQRAHENEYCEPVHATKEDTDADFNKALDFCVRNLEQVSICLGTHNEYSCLYMTQQMRKLGVLPNDPHVWFAQLLGMSDNISYNLANAGYNVAKYVPYGPVEAVMPYLFRRASENTSVAGQASREFTLIKNEVQRRRQAKKC